MSDDHSSYGNFLGGDPRRFTPDGCGEHRPDKVEGCRECEDVRAWETACARWTEAEKRGERPDDEESACQAIPGVGFVTLRGFGLGVNTWDCDGPDCSWCGDPDDGDPDDGDEDDGDDCLDCGACDSCVNRMAEADPEDASAAFTRWSREAPFVGPLGKVVEPSDRTREAFLAGWRARGGES